MYRVHDTKVYGIEDAIKASSFPMRSNTEILEIIDNKSVDGKDWERGKRLGNAISGSGHDCYLKGILVTATITASNKFWIQFLRYHFCDIISSSSTMHSLSKKGAYYIEYTDSRVIDITNELINKYKETKNEDDFLRMIYSFPSGLLLTASVSLNYLQIKSMYKQRKHHRLPEWKEFCKWAEKLPMFDYLCLDNKTMGV